MKASLVLLALGVATSADATPLTWTFDGRITGAHGFGWEAAVTIEDTLVNRCGTAMIVTAPDASLTVRHAVYAGTALVESNSRLTDCAANGLYATEFRFLFPEAPLDDFAVFVPDPATDGSLIPSTLNSRVTLTSVVDPPAPVPEPSSLLLLGAGMLGLSRRVTRRRIT